MNRLLWMALVLVLFVAPVAAKERVWTDTSGRTMRAEFVREVDGDVTFLRSGKLVTIPLDKLVPADQQVVRDLAAGKPLPEDAVAAPRAGEFGSESTSELGGDSPANSDSDTGAAQPLMKQPIAIENRVWTDIHGNQTTARYVRIFGANVVLSRSGRSITVKYHELTASDQEYLQELLESRGQEAMIPPPTSAAGSLRAPGLHSGQPMNESPTGSVASSDNAATDSAASDPMAGSPLNDPAFGPVTSPGSTPFTPPTRMGSDYGATSTPGYSPSSGGATPGISPVTPGASTTPAGTSPSSYGATTAPSGYGSSLASANHYPSPLRERVSYGQPSSNDYAYSPDPVVGACSSCRRGVTQSQSVAERCPHCGIRWSYKEDPVTRQKLPIPRLDSPDLTFDPHTARTIGIVVGALVAILIVVGLIIGVVYAVMGLASVSSGNHNRQHPLR